MLIVRFRAGDATRYGVLAKGFDTFCPIGPCIAIDLEPNEVSMNPAVQL